MTILVFLIFLLGLYIYASARTISCYEEWKTDFKFYGGFVFRYSLRSSFQVLLGAVFLILTHPDAGLLGRTTRFEQTWRQRLLTKSPVELAPALRFSFAAACLVLLLPALFLLVLTLHPSVFSSDVEDLTKYWNRYYVVTKFTRLLTYLLGTFFFISKPRDEHKMRFVVFAIPCLHAALVLVSIILCPELDGGERLLPGWNFEANFSVLAILGMALSFPFLNDGRGYLALQSDAEIEEHFQKSFLVCTGWLPPAIFLVSETIGCISNASTDTCRLLTTCNFTVAVFLTLSSIFYLYFNHGQSHLVVTDFLSLRNVDPFTLVAGVWGAIGTTLAYCCFGLRPKNLDSVIQSLDSSVDHPFVIERLVNLLFLSTFFGFFVVGFLAFFHIRHEIVKIRSDVNGGDVDEYMSSSIARHCLSFERSSAGFFSSLRVPEGALSVSPLHMWAVLLLFLLTPITFLVGAAGIAAAGDASFPRGYYAMMNLSQILKPSMFLYCAMLMFLDWKEDSR